MPLIKGLTSFTTGRLGFWCDICKNQQAKGATLYGCRQCDYDICTSCRSNLSKKEEEKKTAKEKTTTVKTTIVEHFWKVSTHWEISAYPGADPNDKVVLATGAGAVEQVSRGDRESEPSPPSPLFDKSLQIVVKKVEAEISWLLSTIAATSDEDGGGSGVGVQFAISRDAAVCKTPRRNADVDAAVTALQSIRNFAQRSSNELFQTIFGVDLPSAGLCPPHPRPLVQCGSPKGGKTAAQVSVALESMLTFIHATVNHFVR